MFIHLLFAFATTVWSIPLQQEYVSTYSGACRILLSAPHGGSIKPPQIDDRQHGCLENGVCNWEKNCTNKDAVACRVVRGTDINTKEITYLISRALVKRGCLPFLVIANMHRSKVDFNRARNEAAQFDPIAEAAWDTYHNAIITYRKRIERFFNRGIVFDIHGQAHADLWTEIGTLLSKDTLNSGQYNMQGTSLQTLADKHPRMTPQQLTYGNNSFGGKLASKGYKVVPSPNYPSPGDGGFFSGGYITQTYGSKDGGNIDGIQVEITTAIRRNETLFRDFAEDIADVMLEHLEFYDYYKK